MKTYKEDTFFLFTDYTFSGGTSKKNYSKIIKTASNRISINEGRVLVYRSRNTKGNYGSDEVTTDSVYQLTKNSVTSFFYGGQYARIEALSDYELTKSCGVYVKVTFSTVGGGASLIDIGYEDGSVDETLSPRVFGLLSKKEYQFGTYYTYEIHETEPEDSDDESLTPIDSDNGYDGYFYIKIADIELENGKFKIKQRHTGVIELSEPQIYFGAYELTVS